MSAADDSHLKHRVPKALALRLKAIRNGTNDPHEWHQAGVLLSELAESARRIRYRGWTSDFLALLNAAEFFFNTAYVQLGEENPLQRCAVETDMALAKARCWFVLSPSGIDVHIVTSILKDVIRYLEHAEPTPQATHQLAIAQGFLARVYWYACLTTGERDYADAAWLTADKATKTFRRNESKSPDNNRAFTSHLIAMALTRSQSGAYLKRWTLCFKAGILARLHRDRWQNVRANIVALFGNMGERLLRRMRDRPSAIKDAVSEVKNALA